LGVSFRHFLVHYQFPLSQSLPSIIPPASATLPFGSSPGPQGNTPLP
jgi:hypothetical protein